MVPYLPNLTDKVPPIHTPKNPPRVKMATMEDQSRVRDCSEMTVWYLSSQV